MRAAMPVYIHISDSEAGSQLCEARLAYHWTGRDVQALSRLILFLWMAGSSLKPTGSELEHDMADRTRMA